MDELGFRPCVECGERALIELRDGTGRVCGRCYVKRRRADAVSLGVAKRDALERDAPQRTNGTVRLNTTRARG